MLSKLSGLLGGATRWQSAMIVLEERQKEDALVVD